MADWLDAILTEKILHPRGVVIAEYFVVALFRRVDKRVLRAGKKTSERAPAAISRPKSELWIRALEVLLLDILGLCITVYGP